MTQYTYSDSKALIDSIMLDYFHEGTTNKAQLSLLNNLMNAEVVVRDYFMGQPEVYGTEGMIEFANKALYILQDENCLALKSVLSSWQYEIDNKILAVTLLGEALEIDETYSFANLLLRVFNAEWAGKAFASMRAELHPKVIEQITSDELIIG